MTNLWSWLGSPEADALLKIVALLGAAIAFGVGLMQYRKAQCWKRMEWVAQEMDAFLADARVEKALCMIDWGKRRVELHPGAESEAKRFVVVDDDSVAASLEHHSARPHGFSEDEAAIRDIFDHFLDRLGRIQSFVEAKLLHVGDVRPYLRYWAEHILKARSDDRSVDRIVQLRRFIVAYEYEGVRMLLTDIASRPWPSDPVRRPTGLPAQSSDEAQLDFADPQGS